MSSRYQIVLSAGNKYCQFVGEIVSLQLQVDLVSESKVGQRRGRENGEAAPVASSAEIAAISANNRSPNQSDRHNLILGKLEGHINRQINRHNRQFNRHMNRH